MREMADYYAEEGYMVLVPDLFWRQELGSRARLHQAGLGRAPSNFYGLDEAKGVEDIGDTVSALRSLTNTSGEAGCSDSAWVASWPTWPRPAPTSTAP